MSENLFTASPGEIEEVNGSAEIASRGVELNGRRAVARDMKRRLAVVIFGAVLSLWVVLFLASGSLTQGPSPKHLGGDFVLFLSGAKVVETGGNPYDQRVLYQSERQLLHADGVRPPAFDPYMRVGNPPLLFWLVQPLTRLSFSPLTIAWCAAMYALCGIGFLGFLSFLVWRRRLVPLVFFMAMPQTLYAAYYGNVDGVVVAGLGLAVALVRKHPFAAGALLTVTVLKPQVALPGACLIVLFLSRSRLRAAAGFCTAAAIELLVTLVTTGPASVGWWLHALIGYSARLGVQPDIASLSGLYVYGSSDPIRIALEVTSLGVAVAATALWWWPRRSDGGVTALAMAWLWILWFLATPFAHFHDEVVLTLAVLAILGLDGKWIGRWPATLTLYVLLFSLLVFPTSRAHTDFQSLTLLVVLACAVVQCLRFSRAPQQQSPGVVNTGLAGLALPVSAREDLPADRVAQAAPVPVDASELSARPRLRLPRGSGIVAPILILEVLLWVFVFGIAQVFHDGPNGKSMGTDFAVFSGAASALKHGQNPYDYRVLYRSERELLTRQHLPVTTNKLNVRAGNPPLFYWILEPLTTLPFQQVAMVWIVAMYLTALAGFFLSLRYFRWTSWVTPALVFALMPQ
ncbi:MAG TPA: glycosyltransferase family 87 protein, partial [Chloroflexota bacterium]